MAKKITEVVANIITPEEKTQAELTDSCLTVAKVGDSFSVLRVRINPETNDVGEIEIVASGLEKVPAHNMLRIQVSKEILLK